MVKRPGIFPGLFVMGNSGINGLYVPAAGISPLKLEYDVFAGERLKIPGLPFFLYLKPNISGNKKITILAHRK